MLKWAVHIPEVSTLCRDPKASCHSVIASCCEAMTAISHPNVRFLPVVPTNNPVRVEHGNELEHKHVSKRVGTRVIFSQDKVEETVKYKG